MVLSFDTTLQVAALLSDIFTLSSLMYLDNVFLVWLTVCLGEKKWKKWNRNLKKKKKKFFFLCIHLVRSFVGRSGLGEHSFHSLKYQFFVSSKSDRTNGKGINLMISFGEILNLPVRNVQVRLEALCFTSYTLPYSWHLSSESFILCS